MADHKNVYARVGRMRSVTSVARSEYAPFYETYVPRVPEGDIVEILSGLEENRRSHQRDGFGFLATGRDGRPFLRPTAVFRIDIEAWSGKGKFVGPEFEGAFDLPRIPIPFEPPPSASSRGSST